MKKLYSNFISWCKKNDAKAHFYILDIQAILLVPLTFLIRHFFHLGIWNIISAFGVTFIVSTATIVIREKTNKSGWSWRDVQNGYIGWAVGTLVSILVIVTWYFIKSFVNS